MFSGLLGVFLLDGDTAVNFSDKHGLGRNDARDGSATLHRVFSIGEDRAGNIWFGTSDQGAWRYDGKSLTYFTKRALQILQDENGAMWFAGTVDAVSRYEDGKFTNYTVANGLSHNRVYPGALAPGLNLADSDALKERDIC